MPSSLPSIDELSDLSDSEQFMDDEPQELIFSDEDLIVIDSPSTADAPTTASAADASAADLPAEDEPAEMQDADPAVLYVEQEELDRKLEKLPFPPLPATLRKWRERQASPAMKEYIKNIRSRKVLLGRNNYKLYLPFNLRDKLIAMRNRKLATGPYCNRKRIIDEYRRKKEREKWNTLV